MNRYTGFEKMTKIRQLKVKVSKQFQKQRTLVAIPIPDLSKRHNFGARSPRFLSLTFTKH